MTNSVLAYTGAYGDAVTAGFPLGNGYRFYLPGSMRFSVPDSWSPFGHGGINPYAYCGADPINRSDPTGHVLEEFANQLARDIVDESVALAVRGSRAATADAEAGPLELTARRWHEADKPPVNRAGLDSPQPSTRQSGSASEPAIFTAASSSSSLERISNARSAVAGSIEIGPLAQERAEVAEIYNGANALANRARNLGDVLNSQTELIGIGEDRASRRILVRETRSMLRRTRALRRRIERTERLLPDAQARSLLSLRDDINMIAGPAQALHDSLRRWSGALPTRRTTSSEVD